MNQIESYVTDLLVALGIEGFPLEEGTRRLLGAFPGVQVFEWPRLLGALIYITAVDRARILIEPGKWIYIPHELGHLRFDSGTVGTMEFREHSSAGMNARRNEGRARYFSLAFLMPWPLCDQLSAPELAEAAGVPLSWAEERLQAIRRIYE